MDDKTLNNLRDRCRMRQVADKDENARAADIELCKRSILWFFRYWLFTSDPRKTPSDLPFLPYPYQEQFILDTYNAIQSGEDILIEKTRDMGVTWCVLGVFLYCWLFEDHNFLVGSRVEGTVDTIGDMQSHFERIRYMLKALPTWMSSTLGYKASQSGYMKLYKDNGASISGESMNSNFSRQGRYKAILLDEFAFAEKAELIWRSCGESSPCKVVVSTPNGSYNFFAILRKSGKIKVFTFHWKLHPEKDEAWYENKKATKSAKDLAQEIDINYSVSAGEAFYKGFSRGLHLRKMNISRQKELNLSFDYGFIHPNCSIHQISAEGYWIIVDNIFGENQTIEEFGNDVIAYLNLHYQGYIWNRRSFGDPAGCQSSDKSRISSQQILRNMGFPVTSVPSNTALTNYNARKAIIEKKMRTLKNGIPELIINDCPGNQIIVEGFEGGYRYPDATKYGAVAEKPVEDGWFEHCISGDTKVRTLDGWHEIKDLVGKDFITYAYDSFSKRLIPAQARDCRKTQENVELWKLDFDNGYLIATPDHLIMRRDGSFSSLKDLKENDELMPFYESHRSSSRKHVCLNLNDGSICDEHRYIYNWFKGNLRQDHHIHHIDNNPQNNYPSNLQQLTAKEHMNGVYEKIKNSPNQIAMRNGTLNKWTKETRKKVSDKLKAMNNHKVIKTSFYGYGDTYNLEVDNYHNFPANGIMVHNCFNTIEYFAINVFKSIDNKPKPMDRPRVIGGRMQETSNAGYKY